jgi:phosphatidylglycerophosphate synthase
MPNHLLILGIIHTAISILAIFAALYALLRDGKISPSNGRGKLYILLTVIACITGLPIMRTGHPTAGHSLAVIILIVLPIAYFATSFKFLGKSAAYLQVFLMSLTLFFSFIPAVVETLTRLPISHPIADGPNSPIIQMGLLTLVVLFTVGVLYQLIKLYQRQKHTSGPTIDLA